MGLNDVRMRSVSVVPQPNESPEVALYRYLLDPRFAGMTLQLTAHEYMLGAQAGQEALVSLGVGLFTRDAYDAVGLDSEVAVMAEKGYINLGDRSLLGVNVMTCDRDGIAVDVDAKKGLTVLDGREETGAPQTATHQGGERALAMTSTSGHRGTRGALGGSPMPSRCSSHGRRAPARLFDDQSKRRKCGQMTCE